jgi:hypothetical protein
MRTVAFVGGASSAFGIPLIPLQFVTTFVGGCLVALTFGLLLIPLSLVWIAFLGALLGLSRLWLGAGKLGPVAGNGVRFLIAAIGVPIAVVAAEYAALVPSMGEVESRASKLMLSWSWPYSWLVFKSSTGDAPEDPAAAEELDRVIQIAASTGGSGGASIAATLLGYVYGIGMLVVLVALLWAII